MDKHLETQIINYMKPYEPNKIGIFGSFARNEQTDKSDIDVLVDFKKKVSFFELGKIQVELSDLIKRNVDLVTERSMHPKLKTYILKDLKIIFG